MKPQGIPLAVDPASLGALKTRAATGEEGTRDADLREVARQFESLFTHMLMKNMRAANLGEGYMDSEQSHFYRDMFDQQMASELANGRGLGIADMLVRQLGGEPQPPTRRALRTFEASAGAGPVAAVAERSSDPSGPRAFIERLLPHARRAAGLLKVSPRFLLAQAALETGWGKFALRTEDGQNSHNLFGIKANANWSGRRARATTQEFVAGTAVTTQADFRAYASEAESFDDYARLLLNSTRYRSALGRGGDGKGFAEALQNGGYATDPHYASKILGIANGTTMNAAFDALKIP